MSNEAASIEAERKLDRETALAHYNLVVKDAELREIVLLESKFKVDLGFHQLRERERNEKKVFSKRTYDSNTSHTFYNADDGVLAGWFHWDLVIKKGRKTLLSVSAVYAVMYTGVPEVEEEPALAFLNRVGKFASYPYFRTLVATLTSAARVDLPPLPVLK